MKKLWKRLFAFALTLVLCTAFIPQPYADAAEYTDSSKLATAMEKTYNSWNNSILSSTTLKTAYYGAWQCAAFTRYMFNQLYGHTDQLANSKNAVGCYHAASVTELGNIIRTNARPGDAIRVSDCSGKNDKSGSESKTHIFILVSAGQNDLTRYESNNTNGKNNKARLSTATYKAIATGDACKYTVSSDGNTFTGGKVLLVKVIHAQENKIGGTSNSTSTATATTITSGETYIFTNKASGRALDVEGNVSKSTKNSNVHIYTNTPSNKSEQFKVTKTSSGWYNLIPLSNTGLAVNPYAAAPKNGTNVNVYTLDAKDKTMGWTFEQVGSYYVIRSAYNSSLVLTATGTANQSNVKLATYSANNSYQLWSVGKV